MSIPDLRPARPDLGPVTREYVKSMRWRSVNMHTHISLVNKYVYVEVPKAGCGTMKATLGGLEAARKGPGLVQRVQDAPHNRINATPFVKPFQLPSDMLEEVLTSPAYRRFAVVRDPASRVLSGYLEKIGQGLKQSEPIVAALGIPASEITFAQFLDVIGEQPSREQDPHWRRQADHLGWGIVDYDDAIHLEELDVSWDRVGALTGIADLRETFYCKNSTGASAKIDEYFTAELREKVRSIYQRDYEVLGY
ncbi:MAG: sulfotransferase family protein [Candidatus Nanopelagicales bacterium]